MQTNGVKEAIVLSQMSQIRALPLFEGFPVPVLTSPSVSLGLLREEIMNMDGYQLEK